jgi:hypothetical protein
LSLTSPQGTLEGVGSQLRIWTGRETLLNIWQVYCQKGWGLW